MKNISKFEKKAKNLYKNFKKTKIEKNKKGRPRKSVKKMFYGIMYVLITGCQWHMIPEKYGCSKTIYGTFRRWIKNDVFKKFYNEILKSYEKNKKIKYPLAIDGSHSKAYRSKFGGKSPVDRAKNGVKIIVIVDQNKVPLSIKSGSANTHDSVFYKDSLDSINSFLKKTKDTKKILADSAFDSKDLKSYSRELNVDLITNNNKRRSKKESIINPILKKRSVVENFFSWFHSFRSIKNCWCLLQSTFDAFLQLASIIRIIDSI